MRIADRSIGPDQPCYVIAEAGVNHDGDVGKAVELVAVAAEAGADAVKFQTFRAETLASAQAPMFDYVERRGGAGPSRIGGGESQREMLARLELPIDAFERLRDEAAGRGIAFWSTPFDPPDVAVVARLGAPAIKLPSGEINHPALLDAAAASGLPIVMSTGMATLDEVRWAIDRLRLGGATKLALLHCVSCYPADPADMNLRAMDTLAATFDLPVGLSDHTLGLPIALAAVARGASLLEKHFTLDRAAPGPDHAASLEPDELTRLVREVRQIESAMGDGQKRPIPAEEATRRAARRSLVAARDLEAGTVLTADMLIARRPGTGLPPTALDEVLGARLNVRLDAGRVLERAHLGAG